MSIEKIAGQQMAETIEGGYRSVSEVLFSPGRIGKLEVKNRLIMPPMVRNYADKEGFVTPRYQAHVERMT